MKERGHRRDYKSFRALPTRWADNDMYGHINNVAYYGFFDTVVNSWLIENAGLDIHEGDQIGLVVETGCRFFSPLSFPTPLVGALRVERVGTTSVVYEVGIFEDGGDAAAAEGRFVHVYVDRLTRKPVPLSMEMRTALRALER